MSLSLSPQKPPRREILPLTTVLGSPIPLSAQPGDKNGRWLLAIILLPLIVTLLFLLWQLTPWGDPCPEEARCEPLSVSSAEHVAAPGHLLLAEPQLTVTHQLAV